MSRVLVARVAAVALWGAVLLGPWPLTAETRAQDDAGAPESDSPEVLREWAIRARALRGLGELSPLLALVPEPDDAFLGEGWRGRRSALEALRRARRFADVAAPPGTADGLASRPELAAVAIAASRPDVAAEAIERGLLSSFGAVRTAAAERLARALHEAPGLRARTFPAPASGLDLDAAETIARARARAGLAGGAVPAWLAAEGALGLGPGRALEERFDDLVRAPLDARAITDLRAAFGGDGTHWLVEVLATIAALRDDAAIGADLGIVRAGLLDVGLDFELASALFGAVDAAARTGRAGVGAPVGELALELGRDGRADLVEAAARLLPPERAVAAARTLDSTALRAAFVEELDSRDVWIEAAPFAAWLTDDLEGAREDAGWLLELAARRYQYGGQPDFGELLSVAVLAEDAWDEAHRDSTLDRIADLTRAESSGEHAASIAAAFRAAPPEVRDDVVARLYPGPGASQLGPEFVRWIERVPARAAPRNTFEVAARLESAEVRAALLGAFQRSIGSLCAAVGVDGAPDPAVDAIAQQCGEALLAGPSLQGEVGAAVAVELARVHRAFGDAEPRCLAPLMERLAETATGDLSALAPLMGDSVADDLRGRAAEAVVRGAARAARRGAPHDADLARAAAAHLAGALERVARSPGLQPIGRTTAMFRALGLAPPEHLPRAEVLRVVRAGVASPRTPFALLAIDFAAARGELAVLLDALEVTARDPLTGERALATARAALRGLDLAWRRAAPEERDAPLAAERLGALARLAPSDEEDGDYAVELLRGEAMAAAAGLVAAGLVAEEGDAARALEGIVDGLFGASLARSARATRARLEGREQAAVLSNPDPSVRAFEALGVDASAQRAALRAEPRVLARLDARVLTALAEGAVDPEVAVALRVAADVAREGERPGRDAERREAEGLIGLVRAAADAESEDGLALAHGALRTLLGRMRSGALPPRVLGLVLSGPLIGSGADALALVAAEAWRARTPVDDLERALRSAFLACEPAPR